MATGLLALIGKAKPAMDKDDDEESPESSGGGAERMYAKEAFSALQDGDEEGFVTAFLGAVKACSKKAEASEYGDEE